MKTHRDLTKGPIFSTIIKLVLPIIATSLVQMAYQLTDMLWIGRVGSEAVAAVGSAGFFVWFGFAFIIISKVGAEVGVAMALGRDDRVQARRYGRNALQINIITAVLYGSALFFAYQPLIAFFRLQDTGVITMAESYLRVVAVGTFFAFINPVFTGIYNGMGQSKIPFYVNSIGLLVNIVLDPLLIFGWGMFPTMGVIGAAIATVIAQSVVTIVFLVIFLGAHAPFPRISFIAPLQKKIAATIVRYGSPVAIQSGLFTVFAMFIARLIATWGPVPIAVQKVGSHIEAISWMTAGGFSSALSAFVGQNFGAGKWDRIQKGYTAGLIAVTIIGSIATILLVFFAKPIFKLFIPEPAALEQGIIYLRILGLSQIFMCWEIATSGSFNGLGRTVPPSVVSVILTGLRVPVAYLLALHTSLGLTGVWWSISMSSVVKGIILVIWFVLLLWRHPCTVKPQLVWQSIFRWDLKFLRDKRCIGGKS